MRYYIMVKDKNYTDVPRLLNWFGAINVEHIINMKYDMLRDMYAFVLQENQDMYVPDIIVDPFFLASKMVKYCIEQYEPNVAHTLVGLVEKNTGNTYEFYIPHLVEIDCLAKNSIISGNGAVLEKVVFDTNKIDKSKYVFRVKGINAANIAVCEAFAESILKRGACGIKFIKVEQEG